MEKRLAVISSSSTACQCDEYRQRIDELEHINSRLIRAIQREAYHMEDQRIHHKDEISDIRRWLKRD